MLLQLALDFITINDAKSMLEELSDCIDIVEIGTPFVVEEGMHAVREIRAAFPSLTILADLKIMDAGAMETKSALVAGADIVTVLGVACDATISASVDEAKRLGGKVLADMIDVPDVKKRAVELDALGVDYICVHTAFDVQATGANPIEELQIVSAVVKHAKTAVAGGVKLSNMAQIAKLSPEIVIVGGGITGQADMRKTALEMKRIMSGGNM